MNEGIRMMNFDFALNYRCPRKQESGTRATDIPFSPQNEAYAQEGIQEQLIHKEIWSQKQAWPLKCVSVTWLQLLWNSIAQALRQMILSYLDFSEL